MVSFSIVFILIFNITRVFTQSGFKSTSIGYMTVNEITFKTKTTTTKGDNFQKYNEYDIGDYIFNAGEIAKFSCKSLMEAQVVMFFYDDVKVLQEYTEIPGTKDKMATMYLKLTKSHHNNSYFICQLSDGARNKVIRVNLIQKDTVIDYALFKINDLILRPLNIKGAKADHNYLYEFYEDEIATITAIADKNYYNRIDCLVNLKKNSLNVLPISKTFTEFKLKIVLNKLNDLSTNISIFCTVFPLKKYDKNMTISLYLRPYKENNFDPEITGLSWSKVLQKYKRYQNIGIIHYNYQSNEELILNCSSSSGSQVHWTFDKTQVFSPIVSQENKTKKKSFVLMKAFNKTLIKCSTDHSSTHLLLKRIDFDDKISEDGNLVLSSSLAPSSASADTKSNLHGIIVSVIISIVAILIILLAIWTIMKLYKRKRKSKQLLENAHYENLSHHNEVPIEENHAHTNLSRQNVNRADMYTKPTPNHLRQREKENNSRLKGENENDETNYAEPFGVFEDGPYAEIVAVEESVDLSENYAIFKVKPKGVCNEYANFNVTQEINDKFNVEPQIDEEFNDKYANLDLKTNANRFSKSKNKNYIVIQHSNNIDNTYGNVFENENYENLRKTEYSEIHKCKDT